MRRRATMLLVSTVALAAACVIPPRVSLTSAGPIPVGGAVEIYTTAPRECPTAVALWPFKYCRHDHALRSATSDAPDVVAIEALDTSRDAVLIRGLRPGRATVTADTSGGRVSNTFEVRAADDVQLAFRCDPLAPEASPPAPGPYPVPAGGTVGFWFAALGGGERLDAREWPCPFDGVITALCATPGGAHVTVPGVAGATWDVTFQPDPSRHLLFTTYDPATFDGLDVAFTPFTAPTVGAAIPFHAIATVGGEIPCIDQARRTATIETPDACSFWPTEPIFAKELRGRATGDERPGSYTAYATAPGTCRITVALDGTALSGTAEIGIAP